MTWMTIWFAALAATACASSVNHTERWVEAPGRTVVVSDGLRVLGTAKMGPNRPGPGSQVSTVSSMVAGDARGRGVGRALDEYVLSWTREKGYAAIQFNAIVESNHVAVRHWQALGFHIIGAVPEPCEHSTLGCVGLHPAYGVRGAPGGDKGTYNREWQEGQHAVQQYAYTPGTPAYGMLNGQDSKIQRDVGYEHAIRSATRRLILCAPYPELRR